MRDQSGIKNVELVRRVSGLAGPMTFIDDIRQGVIHTGISGAIALRDTPMIFDWLLTAFSFQGVSDQAARTYIERNGTASWAAMQGDLLETPACHRLASHGDYRGCR
jgi:hypothetical protein